MYNFKDVLELFNLQYNFTLDDLKRAKKVVLMTHPDKSRLPSEYFLFYKQAYKIVYEYYNNNNKQNNIVPNKEIIYQNNDTNYDENTTNEISKQIKKINKKDFNQQFNKLFDKNMVSSVDIEKNKWFEDDKQIFNTNEKVNANNIGDVFNTMKLQQHNQGLVKYNGVQNLFINSNSGSNLYDDDNDEYVTTDPFSKLKFDDLRKVHKDQTIFAVSEKDINKVQQFSSVDHYMKERSRHNLNPLEKQQAEQKLNQEMLNQQKKISQKEYKSKLQTMDYTEKNKKVLSTFLQIKN
tara:strand:- start:71 stop:949 length:879 start_codon:yes stop_codon:yes gene_type:complete